MTEYIISFKNGHKMKVVTENGDAFIKELLQGTRDNPTAKAHIYTVGKVIINVDDITACHPVDMEG